MWHQAAGQIESIHSMMESGHRSVTLERHTLYLWGITTALLVLSVRHLFTSHGFPIPWQRAFASTAFIACVLILVGLWDYRLTLKTREKRDETLSFIQAQLIKVWWGIVGIIVLINLGMHFFGGGYLFYPIMISLVGLAFYVQGLFSQQLLSWVGIMMVLLGLGGIGMQLSIVTLEWLTVMLFGIGFPILAWLLNWRPKRLKKVYRMIFSIVWLSSVALPTYAVVLIDQQHIKPSLPIVSLAQFKTQTGVGHAQIVHLPVGTTIPVRVHIHSPVLANDTHGTISLQLSQALELVLDDGKLTGQYRIGDGLWNHRRDRYAIRSVQIKSSLAPSKGPQVDVRFDIQTPH